MGPRADLNAYGKVSPPTGIRSPDRKCRSELLYQLRYPGLPSCLYKPAKCFKSPRNFRLLWRHVYDILLDAITSKIVIVSYPPVVIVSSLCRLLWRHVDDSARWHNVQNRYRIVSSCRDRIVIVFTTLLDDITSRIVIVSYPPVVIVLSSCRLLWRHVYDSARWHNVQNRHLIVSSCHYIVIVS
jgi:hypothetical protein